jgi:hypothetical protein
MASTPTPAGRAFRDGAVPGRGTLGGPADVARNLLQALRDSIAVQRAEGNDAEDQQIERPLGEIRLRCRHTLPFYHSRPPVEGQGVRAALTSRRFAFEFIVADGGVGLSRQASRELVQRCY